MRWTLLQNSLVVAGATTVLAGVLGFFAALCIAAIGARGRHWLLLLSIAALAMPPFLVTNCWLDLLGETGALRRWLPLNIYSLGGAVWILSLLTWPLTLLAALAAWQQLEPAQLESEPALRGAALIRWLLWPAARMAAGLAAGLTFVLALNNLAVPAILQVKVAPAELWVSFNTNLDSLAALKLGWPLIVAPVLLLLALGRGGESRWPRLEGGVGARLFRRQLGRGWFAVSTGVTALLALVSVGLPVAQLAASQRTWLELLPALAAGTTAVADSILNGAVTATTTVVLGLLCAGRAGLVAQISNLLYRRLPVGRPFEVREDGGLEILDTAGWKPALRAFGTRSSKKVCETSWLTTAVLFLPLFVPGIFLGLALIWALNRPGLDWFYRSVGVVLLALALRYLGLAWWGARLALRSADRDLTDAARLDGARGWTLFRLVQWPQIAPQVGVVWYVVYLLCLWDVETIILVLPPGGETLALRIFNLLHYGHSGQVNALCLWLLLVAILPLALWRTARWVYALRFAFYERKSAAAVCVLALVSWTGCGGSSSRQAFLESRLFSHVEIIGIRGAGAGEFNKPRSVAVDRQDCFYVVDMTGRVQKFSPDGKFLLSWQMPQTDLGKPKGLARDQEGNIVVIEPHYQRVNHFSPEGKLAAQWGGHLTNGGPFSLPRAVAVNSRGEVIVSEYTLRERVQVFSAFGKKRLCDFGQAGTGPGRFNRAEGVAVDGADRIYVADSCNHRIQVFSPEGRFLRAHGRAGNGPGEFSYPYDLCVDAAGHQYVCEFGNHRIQILDANDHVLEILGGAGAGPGRFANPWGLALNSKGDLYVADSQNHRVQKFVRKQPLTRNDQ